MTQEKIKCLLCNYKARHNENEIREFIHEYNCRRCGEYILSQVVEMNLEKPSEFDDKKYILSGHVRECNKIGKKPEFLLVKDIQNAINFSNKPSDISDSIDRILLHIYNSNNAYNDYLFINWQEYPIAYAKNYKEFLYLLSKCVEFKYLESKGINGTDFNNKDYRLTIKGIKRCEKLKKGGMNSKKVFVAMWFDDKMDSAYIDGIKRAIEELELSPINMKYLIQNDKICDRIIVEIKKSRFLIADITGNREMVYYEAGYAMGLGRQVIWTCDEKDWKKKKVRNNFDTRQYPCLIWNNNDGLREQLKERIQALGLDK